MAATPATSSAPPIVFDGEVFWYTQGFDPDDDRCCSCRKPIEADSVPLAIFKEVPIINAKRPQVWQARFCARCSRAVFIRSRRV